MLADTNPEPSSRWGAGSLIVISAPSGAGKTSLVKAVVSAMNGVVCSVSHTTRPERPGEQDGVDYHFVSPSEFDACLRNGDFLEYARVFDHSYGTSRQEVLRQVAANNDVILEIDWQGARQIRQKVLDCVSVFILPPSREELERRLRGRGQDEERVIARRLADARSDMSHYAEFDFLVINDDFQKAVDTVCSIIVAARTRTLHQAQRQSALLQSLLA
ncbi:MAG: guanylate kinase [Pseudomonadota bacterium]|nr:guanylate kinase [Pseudomonadota bacterium]